MFKIYTNPTCHYCNRIKEQLNNAEMVYEEIVAQDNPEEWNELVRITGIGMTPTIVMQEEIWLPNRDFRTPEELIGKINHFKTTPMKNLMFEERINQLHNTVKNLTLLLNQMNQTITQINGKVTPQPPINSGPGQPQVQAAQNQK
jgi:glutaredoxin|tara:strand:- start:1307 stop:1741 length:435 start_codon:yes stop_codon:yes gene_type:complete